MSFCKSEVGLDSTLSFYKAEVGIIEAFNSTSRYLADLLKIDNVQFEQMVDRIYSAEFRLNNVNSPDTEAPLLDLNISISNGTVSTKIYDKQDDFDFDIYWRKKETLNQKRCITCFITWPSCYSVK